MKRLITMAMLAGVVGGCSEQASSRRNGQAQPPVATNTSAEGRGVEVRPPTQRELVMVRTGPDAPPTRVRVGQAIGVTLGEHPSVGFTWDVTRVEGAVRRDGSFTPPRGEVHPGGDAGPRIFRFVATRPGEATILFTYSFRGTPEQEMLVRVVVE